MEGMMADKQRPSRLKQSEQTKSVSSTWPSKEMALSHAGVFSYGDLLNLLTYEWEQGQTVSKIWITKEQAAGLQAELLPDTPEVDTRPKLVRHMYPKQYDFKIETLHTPAGDVKVMLDE